MFCEKCRGLMFPQEGEWTCRKCGYVKGIDGKKDAKTITAKSEDKEMMIIDGKNDTLPKTRVTCPECGNKEAYWVLRQTRSADEPETRIYRCTECGHSWREY